MTAPRPTADVRLGHVIDVLRAMPARSIDSCITSPPYWGLRDYGVPPSIWGGRADCLHDWGPPRRIETEQAGGNWAQGTNGRGERQPGGAAKKRKIVKGAQSAWTCRKCGAWKGCLGLEEEPSAFVAHLVLVFQEVRRVLKDGGTLWVNIGDTFVGGRNGGFGEKSSITSGRNHVEARKAWEAKGGKTHRTVEGLKPKDLVGIPWMTAFALRADGWWLRSDIIWHKPNPMPESVLDRPSRAHEYVFLLSKSRRYDYFADAIRTELSPKTHTTDGTVRRSKGNDALGQVAADNWARSSSATRRIKVDENGKPVGANARTVWRLDEVEAPDVWSIASEPYPHSHFATFPTDLVRPMVLAGTEPGGVVLDPFAGSGTTGQVALELGRSAVLVELCADYHPLIARRLRDVQLPLIAPGWDPKHQRTL
jgi:DNA modification methylase